MGNCFFAVGLLFSLPRILSANFEDEINQFATSSNIMKHSQQHAVQAIVAKPELINFLKAIDGLTNLIPDWTTYQVAPDSSTGLCTYTMQIGENQTLPLGFGFDPPNGIQHIVTPEGSHVVFGLKSDLAQTDSVSDPNYPNWNLMNQILKGGMLLISVPEGKTFLDLGMDISSLGIGFRNLFQLMNWDDPDGDEVDSPDSDSMVAAFQSNPWLQDDQNLYYWAFSGGSPDDQIWTLDSSLNFLGCKRDMPGSGYKVFIFHWMQF
jgi:hypothetical protein